jgi:hypothetical protein
MNGEPYVFRGDSPFDCGDFVDSVLGEIGEQLAAQVAGQPQYIELRVRPDAPDIDELMGRLLEVVQHLPVGGRLPMPRSRWRDTTGTDGVVTVADYRDGHVVVTGLALPDGGTIHPSQFGSRYIETTTEG